MDEPGGVPGAQAAAQVPALRGLVLAGGEERDQVEQADELRTFKDIATLRTVAVERPPDAPTDFAGAAEAARALGMNRLAARLDEATA